MTKLLINSFLFFISYLSILSGQAQCPDKMSKVTGDTLCYSADFAIITIYNTTLGASYEPFENNISISSAVLSPGGTIEIKIPRLSPNTIHHISIKAESPGCAAILLENSATIMYNLTPQVELSAYGDTVCSTSKYANISIPKSGQGIKYHLSYNNNSLGTYVGNGQDLIIPIPLTSLAIGNNQISVSINVEGCQPYILKTSAYIMINPAPSLYFVASGNTVTNSKDSARVVVKSAPYGTSFDIDFGNGVTKVNSTENGNEKIIKFAIPDSIKNDFIVNITGHIFGCENSTYSDTALIKVRRTITSLSKDEHIQGLNIYPNPGTSIFNVQSNTLFHKILVVNMLGETILEYSFEATTLKSIVADFPKGVYSLKLEGVDYTVQKQLVKE